MRRTRSFCGLESRHSVDEVLTVIAPFEDCTLAKSLVAGGTQDRSYWHLKVTINKMMMHSSPLEPIGRKQPIYVHHSHFVAI